MKREKKDKKLKNLFRLEQLFNSDVAADDIEDKIDDILFHQETKGGERDGQGISSPNR